VFLDILKEELLNEDTRIGQLPKKFADFLLYLRASEPVTYELLKNYTDYWWMSDRGDRRATMAVAMNNGRLQFYIGKQFYSELSLSQLAFLMYHELAHYKRGHCNHNFNLGKSNHELANIVEDIYINEDANRDGEFASVPLKFVEGVLMKKSGTYRGAKSAGIDKYAEVNNIKVKESEYMAINNSADLYKYLMKKHKEQDQDPQQQKQQQKGDGEGEPQQGEKITPKKGDIIRGPNGQYGRVSKAVGGKVKEIEPLTKEEAEKIVKGETSFMAIQARRNNPFANKSPLDIA
jgi:hypothetical protein